MVKARKTMFGGYSKYAGSRYASDFILRTGVDMKRKTYSGFKIIKLRDLNIRRK
tara:strand:- start:23 stop:184 length:162 start_codon:yes stop_codon:yes gene_type:complete